MSIPRDFNADWASMKAAYADQEAAQERAAYEAKMRRDDALEAAQPARTWKPTRWELDRLRDGAAERRAHPATTPAGRAEDAALDAILARAEAAYAALGARPELPQAPAAPLGDTHLVPLRDRRPGPARPDAPTDPQLALIARLCDQLGRAADDRPTPSNKREASRMIDALKAQADHAARQGQARPAARPATEAQIAYLRDLLATRAWAGDAEIASINEAQDDELTAAETSAAIDRLRLYPQAASPAATHGIAEGRYAYQPADGSPASFYRITKTGRIRTQAGPAEWPYRGEPNEGLRWIAAHQQQAAALYGQLLGVCGRCGRALTDEDSRARGLGPICADKY